MKKIYMIPTLQVVKIQPAQFIAMSYGGTTEATSGNLSRRGRFSDWEEDEWEEE